MSNNTLFQSKVTVGTRIKAKWFPGMEIPLAMLESGVTSETYLTVTHVYPNLVTAKYKGNTVCASTGDLVRAGMLHEDFLNSFKLKRESKVSREDAFIEWLASEGV